MSNVENVTDQKCFSTVAFYTLGCKVNQYETEAMMEAFEKAGYEIKAFEEPADVYVINTCSVTSMGDRKSRQMIRRPLERNADAMLVVAGCYAQLAPDKLLEIPGVRLVVGTNERSRIVELVEKAAASDTKVNEVGNIMAVREFEEMSIEGYKSHTRAFLKIQEGCDNYCTYCIIPYARGHIRSRRPESVREEVERLASAGYREIVLTGIHVGSYGKDLGDTSLIDLIEQLHMVDGIERLRMGSVEPNTLTDDFLARLAVLPKVCPHFHLSLQSGCDSVLKRMNRKYTTAEYAMVVKKLRSIYPEVAVTTDVIVGFPGETAEEFETTKRFVEQMDFSEIHIFKYSPREGTPAAQFKEQVPPKEKDLRSKALSKTVAEMSQRYRTRFLARTMPVLYEQPVHGQEGFYEGLTDNYLKVIVPGGDFLQGVLRPTKLLQLQGDAICGELCGAEGENPKKE